MIGTEMSLYGGLPQNEVAERAILGAILIDSGLMLEAANRLTSEDFYSPINRRIFKAMTDLFNMSRSIDPVSIGNAMSRSSPIDSIGGIHAITNLSRGIPTCGFSSHVDIVLEKAQLRRIVRVTDRIQALALNGDTDPASIIGEAENAILEMTNNVRSKDEDRSLSDIFQDNLTASTGFNQSRFIPTQLADLNRILGGGLTRGDLVIIGARPSTGKTAKAIGIIESSAEHGHRVAMFSLEMGVDQIASRMIATRARVNLQSYRTGCLVPFHQEQAEKAARELPKLPFTIDGTSNLTPSRLRAKIRRLIAKHKKLDLVIVDYLQLMDADVKRKDRRPEIEEISRALKLIAKEFDVVVVALSQLSRAVETRKGRPMLSDLRESGSIEQDADVVILLHRPDLEEAETELIVAKHRNGPTGIVKALFHKSFASFENLGHEEVSRY